MRDFLVLFVVNFLLIFAAIVAAMWMAGVL